MWPCRMDDEGGPVTVSYGRRESFVLADDMSEFFGTQRSIDGTSAWLLQQCPNAVIWSDDCSICFSGSFSMYSFFVHSHALSQHVK